MTNDQMISNFYIEKLPRIDTKKSARKRRDNGDGSIYTRADGRFVGSLRLPNGKRKDFYGK